MKVLILMSVYNGEKYLEEQIISIINQTIGIENINILIRVDGENDNSLDIIKKYSEIYTNNISYYIGKNLGACGSFCDLARKCDKKYDYYAFSDQDDVWLPNKIEKAIEMLEEENNEIPVAYSSMVTVVDENLNFVQQGTGKTIKVKSFGNAILENILTGCTAVFNLQMLLELRKTSQKNVKNGLFMHDWIVYMIASSYGKFIYDNNSYILYRQHNANVLGAVQGNIINKLVRKFKIFLKYGNTNIIRRNLRQFYIVYKDSIPLDKKRLVKQYLRKNKSFISRFKIVFENKIRRQSLFDNICYKIMILTNRI